MLQPITTPCACASASWEHNPHRALERPICHPGQKGGWIADVATDHNPVRVSFRLLGA